jgi:D-tyrosyl-tRNA(Tyr) deacylase
VDTNTINHVSLCSGYGGIDLGLKRAIGSRLRTVAFVEIEAFAADTAADALWLAEKICALRIFSDTEGKMNLSVRDTAGGLLVVSQFTLIASTRKGTRPSFNDAARPEIAIPLYEKFLELSATTLGRPVARGRFGAMMAVSLVNDGPVTLIIDSHLRE